MSTPSDRDLLRSAVFDLVNPVPQVITVPTEAGTFETKLVTEPPRWARLMEAIAWGGSGGGGSGAVRSRPPIATSVLSFAEEVREEVGLGVIGLERTPARGLEGVPANLATLAHDLPEERTAAGAVAVSGYVRQAQQILGEVQPRISQLRGAKCPECSAVRHRREMDGETYWDPSVAVLWSEDRPRLVCRACAHSWLPPGWGKLLAGLEPETPPVV